MADTDLIKLSRNIGIDIAVDVNGFTRNCRPKIFSGRSAPIQINYLGYPGTMGVNYIDYIVADKYIVPEKNKKFYNEKIIYLPNSFLPSDELRPISNKKYARNDFGLPDDKFIFCCFNNVIKINPEVFSAWTEILKNNENSVLWLSSENKIVINNLKSEAKYKGIDDKRLIFTNKLPQDEYLKLFKLADLFLDTIPYNAGATAIDSLYAGLPILTMSGDSFVSRISGSLMNALNMEELIVNSLVDYVNLASSICKNNKIDEIKSKLTKQIIDSNLFNSKVYTKNIEDAFFKIFYAYQNNLKNNDIYI
jgi:predicted O-linked N-acetylglucosamine transferase (SPINDLY family)